jgi:hypothetical protein
MFIICGFVRLKKSSFATNKYDLIGDFKHTFITPHWRCSGHNSGSEQRKIIPILLIIAGVGIFTIGLFKIL